MSAAAALSTTREAARFAGTGAVTTAVGLAIIYGGMALLAWPAWLANLAGYAAGLSLGFALNRHWTFRHTGRIAPAALRYGAAFAVAYLANLATLLGLEAAAISLYLAQLGGMAVYTVLFYLLNKRAVFRR